MKLKIIENGVESYKEIGFLSFMKCMVLVWLGVYAILFLLLVVLGFLSVLFSLLI